MEGLALLILFRRMQLCPILKSTPALLAHQESVCMVNRVSSPASTENRDMRLRVQEGWMQSAQDEGLLVLMAQATLSLGALLASGFLMFLFAVLTLQSAHDRALVLSSTQSLWPLYIILGS